MADQMAESTTLDASIVVKPLEARSVAAASETVADFEVDFAPIFGRLYPRIYGELGRLGIVPGSPTVAFYRPTDDGQLEIWAGVTIAADTTIDSDVITLVELPAADRAATLVHHGPMTTVDQSYLALDRWIGDAGEVVAGYSREIYHACPPSQDDWVTELQFVLA